MTGPRKFIGCPTAYVGHPAKLMGQILDEDDKEFVKAMLREFGLAMIEASKTGKWRGQKMTGDMKEELAERGHRCLDITRAEL